MPEKSEAPPPQPAPAAPRTPRLPTLLAALNSLLLAAVLAVLLLGLRGSAGALAHAPAQAEAAAPAGGPAPAASPGAPAAAPAPPADAAAAQPGPMVRVPDFVVHLRDVDADRYARVAFEIELQDDKGKDAVAARLPQLRDAFLTHLSDRTVEELRGGEALVRLKGALEARVREVVPGAAVRAVYVTELVVQ
jgi:flagellar FliL protein